LDGIDLFNELIVLYFLYELEELVPCGIQVVDSGVKAVLIHEDINVVKHIPALNLYLIIVLFKEVYVFYQQPIYHRN